MAATTTDVAGRCRPVAIEGAAVDTERRRLDAIFAMDLTLAARWPTGDDALAGIQEPLPQNLVIADAAKRRSATGVQLRRSSEDIGFGLA